MLLLVGQDMGTGRTLKIFSEKRRGPWVRIVTAWGLTAPAGPLTSPLCAHFWHVKAASHSHTEFKPRQEGALCRKP